MHCDSNVAPADGPSPAAAARRRRFDNRELSTIAMLAALHFAVSFVSRVAGTVISVVFGPYAVYVDGLGGEGVPSLLLATALVLVPRFGTAALSIGVVWLLNVLVTGTLSVVSITMVLVSVVVYELVLGAAGVTLEGALRQTSSQASPALTARVALALGVANAIALYVQFFISMRFYKFFFDPWYVHSVALLTGLGYGAVGAAVGVAWGRQLRRAAP